MKRLVLAATDKNVLNSIKDDTYNRDADVRDFVETLDLIEGNMFISLDARWGEGKTFYVRQIEKTLEFLTMRTWEETEPGIVDHLKPYFQNTPLNSINLKTTYFPIYYDAWLCDNHSDPLMSLVSTIVKKATPYLDAKKNKSVAEKLLNLLASISVSAQLGSLQLTVSGDKVKKSLSQANILESIKTAEETRELVKEILNEAITEKAQRLVVFVDELDRCRPSYAIEMLERLKHYFDDERIIFVVSVNKEQLAHTISKYYGAGFDSFGYLNKFFDINAHMPVMISEDKKRKVFSEYKNGQFWLTEIVEGLNKFYQLSLRDSLIYKQRIMDMPISLVNDSTAQSCCLSLFVAIIIVLDIKDVSEKIKFINGDSDVLDKVCRQIPEIKRMICRFGDRDKNNEFEIGLNKFKEVYEYAFNAQNTKENSELSLDVSSNLKRMCIMLCNGVKI